MSRFLRYLLLSLGCVVGFAGCDDASEVGTAQRPDEGAADIARAETAKVNGDLAAASAAYGAAMAKNATNLEIRVQKALTDLARGDADGAETAAAEALALAPESAEVLLVDGQAAYLKQNYPRALKDFAAVAAAQDILPELRSSAWSARAVVELAEGEFDAARVSLLRALRLNFKNAAAHYHLGLIFRDTYHFDNAALEQFQMAARLSDAREERTRRLSGEIIPALRKAIAAAAANNPEAARRDAGKAAALTAEGEALRTRRQMRLAMKKFAAALEADPLCDKAALHYAELTAANDKTADGVSRALKAYRTVIEQNPSSQKHYLAAARLAYANGRWATAAAIMERAVAHDPDNRQTLDLFIAALQKAGKGPVAEIWSSYRKELK